VDPSDPPVVKKKKVLGKQPEKIMIYTGPTGKDRTGKSIPKIRKYEVEIEDETYLLDL